MNYAIVVGNSGPSSANGAAVYDPGSGGTCSGSLTVSGLQTSPGLAIPTFPSGGSVACVPSCQVTATGQ